MIPWYAPTGLKDNIQRLFALRSALVLSAIIVLLVTEFRFDWIERSVGAYLVSTNHLRPESGAVWAQGHKSDLARKSVSQYMHERTGTQREVQRAIAMGQVIAGVDAQRGAMISADHFVELYQKLPPVLSHEIISPYTLLHQLSMNRWKRTYFEQQSDDHLNIYLLDDHNQVLHRLSVGPVLYEHIQRGEVAIDTPLDQLADFADQIYPAEQFFTAMSTLSEESQKAILDSPGNLLAASGRIVRVGISNQSAAEAVDIGFEIEDPHGTKVILTQGSAAHVRQLHWILEEQSRSMGEADGGE